MRLRTAPLERLATEWNHSVAKESLKIEELEHVLFKKIGQLFQARA
jgi:hypothetical protein